MAFVRRNTSGFSRLSCLAIGAALLLAAAAPGAAPAQVPCPANPAWVTNPSNPNFINDPNTLCGFYQYAWQIFLYHMAPVNAKAGACLVRRRSQAGILGARVQS